MTKLLCGLLLASPLLLSSCEKYLDIKTKGTIIPTETVNYRYLMNNSAILEPTISLPDVTSDDVEFADLVQQNALPNSFARAYTWQSFFYDASETDPNWDTPYRAIYYANTVVGEVLASTGGTDAEKQQIRAEALVHRAYAYLALVNTYAKAYDASTAATDPGVPLLLSPTADADLTRAPVQRVYGQIIQDLTDALPNLPATATYNTRPAQVSAYAILARTYLLMGDYGLARQNAERALAIQSTLNDLQAFATATYPRRVADPEVILSKTAYVTLTFAPSVLRLSPALLNLYPTTDLRYSLFTRPATAVSAAYTGRVFAKELLTGEARNLGPSVPEMLLIRAECQARQNDASGAIATLNTLRSKRFTAVNYVPLVATTTAAALQTVLTERRRELCCRCFRWFDQKRLNKETAFAQTVTRQWSATSSVVPAGTYALAPGANRYLFPIPPIPQRLNPEIASNP